MASVPWRCGTAPVSMTTRGAADDGDDDGGKLVPIFAMRLAVVMVIPQNKLLEVSDGYER